MHVKSFAASVMCGLYHARMATDLLTSDFDFDLPPEAVAAEPARPRDAARLLHVGPDKFEDLRVYDLPSLLRPGDVMVLNHTKVIPSRLYGVRGAVPVEILLHKHIGQGDWLAFAKPGKRLRVSDIVEFAPDFAAEVVEKRESGDVAVRFALKHADVLAGLERYGQMPLPPYIRREDGNRPSDRTDYQTVFAECDGSVAAPTAGLHFTSELLVKLDALGVIRKQVTLHVGAGTFLPVKAERLSEHRMHAEWGEIPADTAQEINRARAEGRRVIAVGTTSLRLLESAAHATGQVQPWTGETDIFIYPGFQFRAVDALMTNFHLPKSTLFMLVCAFAGMDRMRAAYAHAIAQGYRFYSYGDASLLERG